MFKLKFRNLPNIAYLNQAGLVASSTTLHEERKYDLFFQSFIMQKNFHVSEKVVWKPKELVGSSMPG